MNIALLKVSLSLAEINQLIKEFPQFLFLSYPESSLKKIEREYWSKIEIFFGSKLTEEEWDLASSLKWIHTPSPNLNRLPLKEIERQKSVLLSNTREENSLQIAEFVMAGALSFAKNLFNWKGANHYPSLLWDAKWRHNMMSLKGKTFLQIGMDKVGKEIVKQATHQEMKVIAIDKERSFHPFCHLNLSIKELRSILPQADIVSVHLPRTKESALWFGIKELELMKEDSILIVTGGETALFENEIIDPSLFEKLRGALIDVPYHTPISPASPLWRLPNLILTPDVAPRPKSKEKEAFRIFRFNLRQYIHGNFVDMKNLIDTSVAKPADENF